MFQAKNLSEFHFDTKRSGEVLQGFLDDARISKKATEKHLGLSYDTIKGTLRGENKDSKLEFAMKICAITNRTMQEWCERMLEGVDETVAAQVRAAFGITPPVTEEPQPDLETMVFRWLDAQARSIDQYKQVSGETRQQYEAEIARMTAAFDGERAAYQAELDRLYAQNAQLTEAIAFMAKEK